MISAAGVLSGARPGDREACSIATAREHNADLIVMTTHGHSGAARWILGSVAQTLIACSELPVLLQRAWDTRRRALLLGDEPSIRPGMAATSGSIEFLSWPVPQRDRGEWRSDLRAPPGDKHWDPGTMTGAARWMQQLPAPWTMRCTQAATEVRL